ncbi:ester cyclase [Haladaptatus sp. CMAA 1911]|uniref:ester cyclase n=1 Tax=unclassified Haladaptatus TaxID=2622732 RepID=UPI003754E0CE
MTAEENERLVRRDPDEIWSDGRVELIDELYHEDFVLHDPSSPESDAGRDEYREYVETYRRAFPDAEYTVDDIVSDGDTVMLRYTAEGTQDGELLGIKPTGKHVTVSGMEEYRVEDGKITEMWTNYDSFGLFRQLGVVPSLAELARERTAD